jgi:hypothetical protein
VSLAPSANRSGNYTVLRDVAGPDFQARNTAADLGQSFSDLRRRNFDLYGVALLAPQLTAAPALDAENRLRLTGFSDAAPADQFRPKLPGGGRSVAALRHLDRDDGSAPAGSSSASTSSKTGRARAEKSVSHVGRRSGCSPLP